MQEEKDRGFTQTPEAAAHHGTLVDVCNWVQLAFRLVALFGEPAKWVVKEIANAWDLYSTSPQDEAHKAFARKVDEIGQRWEELTKTLILAEEQKFGKMLGAGVTYIERPAVPVDTRLRDLYFERAKIFGALANLESRYQTRLHCIESEFNECMRHAMFIFQKEACKRKKEKRINEAKKEYNEEKIKLLRQLQEIELRIAALR